MNSPEKPLSMAECKEPAPPQLCPNCGEPFTPDEVCSPCENCQRSQKRAKLMGSCTIALSLLVIGAGIFTCQYTHRPPAPRGTDVFLQPKVKTPKSLKDLKIGKFYLRRDRGSDMAIAIGDIENVSLNLHRDVKVKLDLLDKNGAVIGSLTDVIVEFSPGVIWHVIASTTNSNAMNVRFNEIIEPGERAATTEGSP